MKKFLLIAVGLIAVLVLGVALAASMRSADYHVERSVVTTASPAAVYAVMCDFERFNEWSPFAKLDPNAKVTISGDKCQTGSLYAWDGNDDAGAGSMAITNVVPDERVDIKLVFQRPMPSEAQTSWITKSEGGQTVILWTMDGTFTSLPEKIWGMLLMDQMLGQMFTDGLTSLKAVVGA